MQSSLPFTTILVPNRGEIAIRLMNGIHALNLQSATVYISSDAISPHVRLASRAYCLGADVSLYTDAEQLLHAAKQLKVDAVLPGYGFVSERPDVAAAFERNGITWIGPSSDVISLFGLKHTARDAAVRAKVSVVPGSGLVQSEEHAMNEANAFGFPVLIKGSAGGGGMGQAIAHHPSQLSSAYQSVLKQCSTLYSSSEIYVEKFVSQARHIEVQVFGDGKGNVLVLGDRECSVQRRRQKVIEEGNASNLSTTLRQQLRDAAARLCSQHNYLSAGTVEFIVDSVTEEWYFLEVNTRLQVEHCVTELVTGIDIVQWMILLAGNVDVLKDASFSERGYAIEARVYAENPCKAYAPSPGTLSEMVWPEASVCKRTGSRIRVDCWAERGSIVSPYYDPLLGKIIAWGKTRPSAIIALKKALNETRVYGVASNVELLRQIIDHPQFLTARYTTDLLKTFTPRTTALEVLKPGLQSFRIILEELGTGTLA
ncbi:Urea amidolyase [Gracilaria domingensis]|nr:Urea amidolyase [Gracilaria domingensis]